MSAQVRVRWLAAYALVSFASFPHPVAGWVVDLGLFASWLAPAALALGLRGLSPRRSARHAFLAGLLAHTAILHWIYVVTVRYGHAPPVLGLLAPAALACYIAAFTAVFGAGWSWLAARGRATPLAGACLWTVLDHLRSFALSGFPWATLGYAQHENDLLLGLASATGVYGLSFTTALAGLALARLVQELPERVWPAPVVWRAAAALLALHLAGGLLGRGGEWDGGPTLRVAALQGNIDQGVKWSPEWADHIYRVYEKLTRRAVDEGARVVLWPETAAPGSPNTSAELRDALRSLARETRALLVVGAVGVERRDDALHFFDSAFLIDGAGEFRDRYDKSHLVPFGEYVPLRHLLGLALRAIATGIAPDNVTSGSGPRAMRLPMPGSDAVTAGAPICYELIFPDEVRRFVGDGARLLLAITNDAWYGRTGAPYQFLAMTALRSAETGVWTVRAANTGVSAIIDARGRVREETRIFERDLVIADVPLRPAASSATLYVRYGDWFAWLCWTGLLAFGLASRLRPRGETEE